MTTPSRPGTLGHNQAAHDHRGVLDAFFSTDHHSTDHQGTDAPRHIGFCAIADTPSTATALVAVRVGAGFNIGPAVALVEAMHQGDDAMCRSVCEAVRPGELLTSLTELSKLILTTLCGAELFERGSAGTRSDRVMATLGLAVIRTRMQITVDPAHTLLFCGDLAAHLATGPRADTLVLHAPKLTVATHVAGALSAYVSSELGVDVTEQSRVWRNVVLAAQSHPARRI